MNRYQRTIRNKIMFEGVGLHSGQMESVTLLPALEDTGIVFVKKNNEGHYRQYSLNQFSYLNCSLCTSIDIEGESFYTVEHLFSVLFVLKITNLFIFIEGEEFPILDGSSVLFWDKIMEVGVFEQTSLRPQPFLPDEEICIQSGDQSSFLYRPSDCLSVHLVLQFDNKVIGEQSFKLLVNEDNYRREICSARTFGVLSQVYAAKSKGLLQGANLSCGVLFGETVVVNGPLRFKEEPVRHKILDFLGDIFLFSCDMTGDIELVCPGHTLHSLVVKKFKQLDNERSLR